MTNIFNKYQTVLDEGHKQEKPCNEIALNLLNTLIDDHDVLLGDDASNVVEHAVNLLATPGNTDELRAQLKLLYDLIEDMQIYVNWVNDPKAIKTREILERNF